VSAGSTPTALLSARGPVTEERAGTYVFGDRQQAMLGGCSPADVGLVVVATVVSADADRAVLDCGAKTLSKDRRPWMRGHGEIPGYPGGIITDLFDYHAMVEFPDGTPRPRLGEQVAVVPNHVCPVVNLFDHIDVVQGGSIVQRWTVDAGRRSS
jgi:D-serine deaminase-like pyridoxal phosphate-dependent protein